MKDLKELTEEKIGSWQQGLEQLHGQRHKLVRQLEETDINIQRVLGAIEGANQILALMQPNDSADAPPDGAGEMTDEPVGS